MNDLIDVPKAGAVLNDIIKAELAGVVRYTHYSLVINLTGLGAHPDQGIARIEESHDHAIDRILEESIAAGLPPLALLVPAFDGGPHRLLVLVGLGS